MIQVGVFPQDLRLGPGTVAKVLERLERNDDRLGLRALARPEEDGRGRPGGPELVAIEKPRHERGFHRGAEI